MKLISFILLNWNGKELLKKSIPPLIEAIQFTHTPHELIIVDNGSTDGSQEFMRKVWTKIKLVCLKRNRGFIGGNNIGAKMSKYDLIMFLNNDIIVSRDFISSLVRHFEDTETFGVSPKVISVDKDRLLEGHSWGSFKNGLIFLENERQFPEKPHIDIPVATVYPIGAAAMVDKHKFFELKGFDKLYSPFYWEDDDLGYRAWKKGWKIIYEPRSLVYHLDEATNINYPRAWVECMKEKNIWLFNWRNLTDKDYVKEYCKTLPCRLFTAINSGNIIFIVAFLLAFTQLLEVFMKRAIDRKYIKRTDKEIFEITCNKNVKCLTQTS